MKKFFLFLMALVMSAVLAFGQQSIETRVANTIRSSQHLNPQVVNPDLIYPGQKISWKISPNVDYTRRIIPGDNQTKVLTDFFKCYGTESDYTYESDDYAIVDSTNQISNSPVVLSKKSWPWWVWGLIAVGLIALWAIVDEQRFKRIDPITAGPAQVPGGVNNARAHTRMMEIAGSRFPGATLNIKNIRRGRLSGFSNVFYGGVASKKIQLQDTPAYAGEISVNGIDQTIYFLQGCGNDARVGRYMSGKGLVFTPNVVVNEDGSESPLPVPNTPVSPEVLRSEYDGQVKEAMKLAEKVIAKDQSHEVSIEIPKGDDGTFKVTFKAQYPKGAGKSTENEKK